MPAATVSKTIEFDMGHRVPNHKSKCRNLHGHRYRVEVGVLGPISLTAHASDEGMVLDFGDLKKIMMEDIHDQFDHGFMMHTQDPFAEDFRKFQKKGQRIIFVPFIPTAENIALHIFTLLKPKIKRPLEISFVKVWETPNSTARYP